MNVTVAEADKLKRKLSVEVPIGEVQAVYAEVYGRLNANLRVDGFRPGKFPRHLAEKRFKEVMAGEAMQTLVPKYYEQALEELKLRPATEPRFDNLDIDKSRPFKFDVELEVVPTFDLLKLSDYKLKENKAKVSAKEVDERIEELRNSRAAYEEKTGPAAKGDAVTFDFTGTLDGEPFDGGSGVDQRIEVGSAQYLPDFDAQFPGIKAGETKTFPLTFPEDYGNDSLAGREVQFEVTAKKVEQKVPPPLDKDFFAQFGTHESEKEFKEAIKSQLESEQTQKAMEEYGNELTEQMRKKYTFDVPETLVEKGLHEFEHRLSHDDPETLKDEKKLEKLKKEERETIVGNLRVAYAIDALAREYDIKAEEEEVKQRFFLQAYMMQRNPSDLMQDAFGRQLLLHIEQNIITNKTLEHLAGEVLSKGRSSAGKSAGSASGGKAKAGAKGKAGEKAKDKQAKADKEK